MKFVLRLKASTQAGTARSTCCTTAIKTPGYRLEPKSIKHQSCKNISTSPSEFIQTRSEHRGTVLLKRKVDSLALELHPQGRRIKYQESKIKDLELHVRIEKLKNFFILVYITIVIDKAM